MNGITPKHMITLAVGIVLGIGIIYGISRIQMTRTTQNQNPPPPLVQTTKEFTLIVKDQKLVSGPSILAVNQDDTVIIHITIDEDEELHLHGYDESVDLERGEPGTLTVEATVSGRFLFELEHSSTDIGALEVQPK